ncbi:MAG TPA: hypothetical protein VI636_07075 [Candidatus Angelobacter sp.]
MATFSKQDAAEGGCGPARNKTQPRAPPPHHTQKRRALGTPGAAVLNLFSCGAAALYTQCPTSPDTMRDWKQKKGIGKGGDSADVVITKYTISVDTAKAIKKSVPTYGSQGRALQVATEMLIRMEDPPAPEPQTKDREVVRVSMRLRKRTYELIRELSELKYGYDTGQVIAACMKVLKMKRIKL